MAGGAFTEHGRLGQNRYGGAGGAAGGIICEEFLRELQGRRGVEVYKEMSENDDIIGAVLFAIEMLMRQVQWDVNAAGNAADDEKAAEFIYGCMYDMDGTWTDFISEALSFLTFGWSYHEIVYKRRMGASRKPETASRYSDGLIGWRKLPIRSQDTLYEWKYDEDDNLLGFVQCAPPDYKQTLIPADKALHFKTRSRKANPEGRSILRNAYRSWYFKRRIQEIEGIGIERDLAGLPMIQPPENVDLYDENGAPTDQLVKAEQVARSVRRDEQEGVVLPYGWTFSLLSAGGRRQFDTNTIIDRYDNRMAMTVLADFVLLGHEAVGSFALSSDKTELFGVALGTFLGIICEEFNRSAIPRLINMNSGAFGGITDYPTLVHGDIETQDLAKLGAFIKDMVGIGAITPDGDMEDYLRMTAGLPEIDAQVSYMGGRARSNGMNGPAGAVEDSDDGTGNVNPSDSSKSGNIDDSNANDDIDA